MLKGKCSKCGKETFYAGNIQVNAGYCEVCRKALKLLRQCLNNYKDDDVYVKILEIFKNTNLNDINLLIKIINKNKR